MKKYLWYRDYKNKLHVGWFWTNVFIPQWILRHDKYWDHKRKIDRRLEYNRFYSKRKPIE